ncbi:LOW QUALITY PROTEIN: atrial natriuretic peptide receptor 1 [Pangasianodon hypophthalmus]|uniref:LOW QUALITY PROTEIN: atrial natriuretic peptide receptor 1 n=1 Tax=Pangasianodon hypophthalmus TaxID=310915 RepID=UPI0023080B7F|nr:LOW QUALITY PROTEIN: atrial natriuretic peptide receptor 1 [Pangasianodon hypophthalmus]
MELTFSPGIYWFFSQGMNNHVKAVLSVLLLLLVMVMVPVCLSAKFTLLLAMPNTSTPFSVGRIGAAALIAIEAVNNSTEILPGHQLDFQYVDDECNDLVGPGRIVALQHKHNYSAFIGPCCSNVCAVTAKLAAYWNIAMVSPVCADQQFLDKKAFPTLTRVFGPFTKLGTFFVAICKQFGWQRISIVYNSESTWSTPAEGIRYQAENNNITVAKYLEIDGPPTHNSTVLQSKVLTEISSSSRIVVISAHGEVVRSLMIEAHGRGLSSGEFVFFCFMPYSQDEMFGSFEWKQGDEYDSVAKQAYQALFILSMYKPNDERYRAFAEEVIKRSERDFGYTYEPHEKVSVLAAIAHDSVWIYAQALHETLVENSDPFNGFEVTRRMWNRTIRGIQGDVMMDASGDREPAYMLKHIQGSDSQRQVIANYFGTRKVYEAVEGIQISWPGGRRSPPKDSPRCGFKGELCNSTESRFSIAVGLIVGLIATGTVSVGILYRKYKLQQKASMMLWTIDASDVITMESRCSAVAGKTQLLGCKSIQASLESIICSMQDKPSAQRTAVYNGTVCCVRFLSVRSVHLSSDLLTELKRCRDLSHQNICKFVGACLDSPQPVILTEYCPKGSLQDILKNDSIKLDWSFKCSLMLDIVKGMDYLHRSPLHSHGRLSSSNCVVDSRFVLKVTDFGLSELRHAGTVDHWSLCVLHPLALLWRAPEILRQTVTANGTQKGDVYSFGIIAQEVVYRRGPFYIPNSSLKAREIVELVKAGGSRPLRPHVDPCECEDGVEALLLSCWRERASERLDFSSLRTIVKNMCPSGGSEKILDDLLSRLEQYACNLEEVVSDRTAQLQEEKKKAEALLTQMLPRSVAAQLIAGRTVRAETYDCVTVYFSDIEGFTAMSASLTPMQVVNMLNDLYTHFDNIIDNHDVYKVETIGDAYMVVSGLPIRNGDEHAREVARMSLAVVQGMEHFQSAHVPQQRLKVRIGIHSGPCVAGVVGLKMPRYCLFGDTVNTASRMESYGLPLKIHVSSSTKSLLDTFTTFQCELRGDIHIKGKGLVRTYWLLGERR